MGLSEIANNRTLAKQGYDLSEELARAVDLVHRAKAAMPDIYTEGIPVSPFGRQAGLFDDEFGDSSVKDATTLLLADILNSSKPSDLRKVLGAYNSEASQSANGQIDMFTGGVSSKEEVLQPIIEHFRNATPKEQQAIVDAAIAERKRQAENRAAEQSGGDEGSEQTEDAEERDRQVGLQHPDKESKNLQKREKRVRTIDPREMTDEEKKIRGDRLKEADPIEVEEGALKSTEELTARQAAEKWWDDNVGEPAFYDTEVGEVEINKGSIENSLAHRYGQMKLDAITSLVDGFENAVYLGTLPDSRERGVVDHYFAYPIKYKGQRCYVFCRAMQDANKNRLYVHEVFLEDKIMKGDTLQTAASKPHGGISLYRDILSNVLEPSIHNRHTTDKQPAEVVEKSQGAEQSGSTAPSRMNISESEDKDSENSGDRQEEGVEDVKEGEDFGDKSSAGEKKEDIFEEAERVAEEPMKRYGRSVAKESGRSLFDWADEEEKARGQIAGKEADPEMERDEISYVERQYLRSGAFSFTGREKIRDRGDVAYIFRELENYCIENVFAVMQKGDGSYKIVHIGMGSPTSSPADLGAIRAAYDAFGADKIWFVHNHPSGVLSPSSADQHLMRMIEDAFVFLGVETEGLIMDTRSGRYSTFHGTGSSENYVRDFEMEEKPVEVYAFDRADRSREPEEKDKLNMPHLVVNYISKLREGKEPRVSYLLLNNQLEVIGNFHTDYKDLGASSLAEEMASVGIKFGAKAIIPYGNIDLAGVKALNDELKGYSMGEVRIVDALQMKEEGHQTAFNSGMMEPDVIYGQEDINNDLEKINETFNTELARQMEGELPEGHIYSLGHPGEVLLAAGFPSDKIELSATQLKKKSQDPSHPFDINEIKDLPKALNNPLAVITYGANVTKVKDKTQPYPVEGIKALNVILELERNGKKFLAGVHFNQSYRGTIVSDIRGLFPRDTQDWLNWIQKGYSRYLDKEKIQDLIDQQRTNLAEVKYLNLDEIANIVRNFDNPKLKDSISEVRGSGAKYGKVSLKDAILGIQEDLKIVNKESLEEKKKAMRKIGGNLNKLRSAMARQREYDQGTMKMITDLAKALMDGGLLDDLTNHEMGMILSAVKNGTGKQDISGQVQRVLDIMVNNQLRSGQKTFSDLISVKGSRVDARGVEVQGVLDPDGQRTAQVVKKSLTLPKDDIENRIAEALNRMGSSDQATADEAAIEYTGLQIALRYAEEIKGSKAEEKDLRESLKQAKEDRDAGQMTDSVYKQYVQATEDAIRQNKIERAEAYQSLIEQMSGVLGESVERAKAWKTVEIERVKAIQHNANSDMEGRPTDEHHKDNRIQKLTNNSGVRFLLAPLATFDQMLRMFGKKNARGEGYLWNRYMRGWVDATEKEYTGYRDALKVFDNKVSEVFGKKMSWGDLFTLDRKLPKGSVKFWDGGEMKEHELTQGNLLYIYMADKMTDGRMKLRKMGITEEDVEDIKNFLDPRFIELADWMQDEFLVEKWNEYNEVHKRMFGASMAAIENYFPLKILSNARLEDVDVAGDTTEAALPATTTGSIIKRRRNNLALDVTGANAFSVILDHLQQMESWIAFAEFIRDLNTLLSYKRIRNQMINMSSAYGGGKTLWNNFRNVCSMAAGTYRPPIAALDKAAVNIAKGVTAAKVSFRVFTALKQFLSMPAYLSDSNLMYLAKDILNPVGAWNWAMDNLPIFEKRWKSRMAGDPRLMKTEMDWKAWRSNVVQMASRIGMSPNAFVDALTVSIGAHAMYETKLAKYLRQGYERGVADKRAKQDATILFNQTQQSSEGAFLSTMQVDRSWLSVLFTVFRNSSMSYTRQLYDAVRNLKDKATGEKELSTEFMAKQLLRDWETKPINDILMRNSNNRLEVCCLRGISISLASREGYY